MGVQLRKAGTLLSIGMMCVSGVLAQTKSSYTGPTVELQFVHGYTGSDRPVIEDMIKNFNASHPNIVVKGSAVAWANTWQQLGPLVSAGKAPDVLAMTEDVIKKFSLRNALTPLTTTALKTVNINASDYYSNMWTMATDKGNVFGVPFGSVAGVMYYNKDLMSKMGVTAVPKTRGQLLSAAQKCTTDKAGKKPGAAGFDANNLDTYGVGAPVDWGFLVGVSAVASNGGALVDKNDNAIFNSPEAVQSVQFLVDLTQKYGVAPKQQTWQSDIASFRGGKSCFIFTGVWELGGNQAVKTLNFGVAPIPAFGRKNSAWGAVTHLVLPRQSASYDANKRAAALEFLHWMTTKEQGLYWTKSGGLPARPDVSRSPEYATNPMVDVAKTLGSLYVSTGYDWVPQVTGGFGAAYTDALLGKKSVKQALDDGVTETNKNIQQARQDSR